MHYKIKRLTYLCILICGLVLSCKSSQEDYKNDFENYVIVCVWPLSIRYYHSNESCILIEYMREIHGDELLLKEVHVKEAEKFGYQPCESCYTEKEIFERSVWGKFNKVITIVLFVALASGWIAIIILIFKSNISKKRGK